MLNIFKTTPKKLSSFNVEDIYEMAVATRSHVKKPYYVIIKSVGADYIETDIPNYHSLKIKIDSPEWEYHIPRMKFIGNSEEDKKLLYNQSHLIDENKFKLQLSDGK